MDSSKMIHSVTLDKEKCVGCTTCVKRCPTNAIRVRDKKATIIKERCIDCGECIRVCEHHAKKAVADPLTIIQNYRFSIALPAPSLYGQFSGIRDRNVLLTALKRIGFDDVFEVSAAAEAVSAATRKELQRDDLPRPVISTACPTVLRIIRVRFPSLLPNLLPYRPPMELAARWARARAVKQTGLKPEEIGCFFISPCPAKATSAKMPIGTVKSAVSGVISIADVYTKMMPLVKKITEPEQLAMSGVPGVSWAVSGGESMGIGDTNYLAADGMENVIRILEALEDEQLENVHFVELNACVGGCVGGALTVENPYIAKARLDRLIRQAAPVLPPDDLPDWDLRWDEAVEYAPVMQLGESVAAAMSKLGQIRELETHFPGMDCGACGAPSCHALAEDIVGGFSTEDQCIFVIREKLQKLIEEQHKAAKEDQE
ncbi:MAG: 4Fe-4S binding protein [Oscillospiraceae bacterium]|nr:4Fe-4S binding protein [Oscillospiraceae bacterium]